MTATATHVPGTDGSGVDPARGPVVATRPVPFARTVHVELRKMVDTRAGRWLLVVMSGISLVVGTALITLGEPSEITLDALVGVMTMPLVLLLPIIGIMAATQEWSQRTGLVTFALEPRRGRVVAAKLVASLVLGLVVIAISALVSAAFHGLAIALADAPGDWSLSPGVAVGVVVGLLMFVLQGVAFGLALLSTPVAIVSSLVLPTVWTIAAAISPRVESVAVWLDLNQVTGPLMSGTMSGSDWAHLSTSALVWIGVPVAVGTWRVLRSEVK